MGAHVSRVILTHQTTSMQAGTPPPTWEPGSAALGRPRRARGRPRLATGPLRRPGPNPRTAVGPDPGRVDLPRPRAPPARPGGPNPHDSPAARRALALPQPVRRCPPGRAVELEPGYAHGCAGRAEDR